MKEMQKELFGKVYLQICKLPSEAIVELIIGNSPILMNAFCRKNIHSIISMLAFNDETQKIEDILALLTEKASSENLTAREFFISELVLGYAAAGKIDNVNDLIKNYSNMIGEETLLRKKLAGLACNINNIGTLRDILVNEKDKISFEALTTAVIFSPDPIAVLLMQEILLKPIKLGRCTTAFLKCITTISNNTHFPNDFFKQLILSCVSSGLIENAFYLLYKVSHAPGKKINKSKLEPLYNSILHFLKTNGWFSTPIKKFELFALIDSTKEGKSIFTFFKRANKEDYWDPKERAAFERKQLKSNQFDHMRRAGLSFNEISIINHYPISLLFFIKYNGLIFDGLPVELNYKIMSFLTGLSLSELQKIKEKFTQHFFLNNNNNENLENSGHSSEVGAVIGYNKSPSSEI